MKTKLSKILGVGLALVLVLGLLSVFAPVKETEAALGEQVWLAQVLPTSGAAGYWKMGAGTDVTEYAFATTAYDGVMYAINGQALLSAASAIVKSPAGGMFWTGLPAIPGAANIPITNIAVAPDNSSVIAVTGGSNAAPLGTVDEAWISTDAGATWAQLPAPNNGGNAAFQRFLDIKVGPSRSGTIYGRDYAIAISDNRTGVLEGTLQILGETATWTNILAVGTEDFTSCEISPNFIGDRIVTAVGSTGAVSNFRTYNCTNYSVTAPALQHAIVPLPAIIDYDPTAPGVNVLASDIALPSNYDVTTPGMERAFVSIASATGALVNVFRCDGILAAQGLMTAASAQAQNRSIAYAGTVTAGRLFVGNYAQTTAITTGVWYTDDAQTNLPVWYPSFKPPTGGTGGLGVGGLAYVRCSPNYSSDTTVYAGTSGTNESAFSASADGGVTYNQLSLIDSGAGITTVVKTDAIQLTSDAGTLFMATDDGAELSLWQTATPPDPYGWTRIFCFTGAAGVLAINPNWDAAQEIYFAETPTVASRFYASVDGGGVFSAYTAPQIGVAITNNGLTVEQSKTLYLGIAANVYSSVNGGQVWSSPQPASVAAVISLAAPGDGVVLVGGIGSCSYSTDGGASFIPLTITGLPATALIIMADEDYATNSTIYVGDSAAAAANNVYRFVIGTSTLWSGLANPSAQAVVGMSMTNGALYAMDQNSADRVLGPSGTVGTLTWGTMATGAPAAIALFTEAGNKAYAASVGVTMWAYDDQMATAKAVISAPASGAVVPVDPVNGRGMNTTIAWSPTGTGQGLGTAYDVLIYDTAAGPAAGTAFLAVAIAPANRTAPTVDTATITNGAGTLTGFILRGGTEYGIWVRAATELSGEAIVSSWSDAAIFSVEPSTGAISPTSAGPQLQSPQPGDQNVNPGASFSWAPMAGVTEYSFILAKDAALTDVVVSETVAGTAYGPITLDPDTDYYYAVAASAPTSSVQSIGAFHTAVEAYTCQYCGLTFDTREALEAHIAAVHAPTTPLYIWIVIAVGAILVIAVIWLIFTTRRA
jgi:hypothetical protein